MGWYDLFSSFYDSSLEALYVDQRALAAEALDLKPGMSLVDLPCGTGQSFDTIAPRVGESGEIFGVDLSSGMLKKAQARADSKGFSQVTLIHGDATTLTLADLGPSAPEGGVDRLHIFLGLSAFPDWRETFKNLWGLLRPGGLCVVVDVHDPSPGFQGKMVNLVARADISRPTWEPLEALAAEYERVELPYDKAHGGAIYLAKGFKA